MCSRKRFDNNQSYVSQHSATPNDPAFVVPVVTSSFFVRMRLEKVCVFITAVHNTKMCAWGGTREEPGTLIQGAPVFPGSSRLGIEHKTPGWLVQDPTTRPIGNLIPTSILGGRVRGFRV